MLLGLLLLSGCSQVKAISPVGSRVTLVRFAALDVLVAHHVDILTAPVCATAGKDIHCVGTTLGKDAITAASPADDETNMEVAVAGQQIYSGSIQAVLDANARPTS